MNRNRKGFVIFNHNMMTAFYPNIFCSKNTCICVTYKLQFYLHGDLSVCHGPGYRVYYARDSKTIVLLLLGGDKATQEKDIVQAKAYLTDYKRRIKHGKGNQLSGRLN